jgi:SNF2 family DNA or RNA helicase
MQALARAHRIGQTNTVTVHYIVAEGTIDQHVINKQYFKLQEASVVLDDQRIMRKIGDIVDKKTTMFNFLEPLQ